MRLAALVEQKVLKGLEKNLNFFNLLSVFEFTKFEKGTFWSTRVHIVNIWRALINVD